MSDTPLRRVEGVADPERCQGIITSGQCLNKAISGTNFCNIHIGSRSIGEKKANNRQYRLNRWRDRLSEFADAPEIKSLREEIGIARISLEEVLNQCKTANDVLIYSDKIDKMLGRIDALVTSCHRMEEKTGSMLDKTKISQILDVVIQAVTAQISDPDAIENITAAIEVNLCQTLQISLSTVSGPVSIEQAQRMQEDGLASIE